ncbi:MAG: hypothetical protein CSA79_03920 [Thiothrix nivea]|nr:MAG: hypothetical protein CSA79_03920 [Thiothrix nivea]
MLRLVMVLWVLALLAGAMVYFSDNAFPVLHSALNLSAERWVAVLAVSKVGAKLLAILGTLALCI